MNNETSDTKTNDKFIPVIFFTILGIFFICLLIVIFTSLPIAKRSKASANTLTIKIKTQGVRKDGDMLGTQIDFYDGPNKAFEKPDTVFVYKDGAFVGDITLQSDFNFTDRYALFIKPVGHIGRVFCTADLSGSKCTSPGFFFMASGSTVDLTASVFLTGDIYPGNGKVDALDMSLIMKDLGKISKEPTLLKTDINSDGIVDVVDYSLAFYSLSNSAADDVVSLTAPVITTPSPTLTATPSATIAPTVTLAPSPTASPSATPTVTPTRSLTPTATPSATITPRVTLTPSPTPAPTYPPD